MKLIKKICLSSLFIVSVFFLLHCGGEEVESGPEFVFTVNGIVCHTCKSKIEGYLMTQDAIINAKVNIASKKNNVRVMYRKNQISVDEIKKLIEDNLNFTVVSYYDTSNKEATQ